MTHKYLEIADTEDQYCSQPNGKLVHFPDEPDLKSSLQNETIEEEELFGLTSESSWLSIIYVVTRQSVPIALSFFVGFAGTFINLLFAGQYLDTSDSTVFAGVSLATLYGNVSCLSLIVGFSGAIETLASQNNGAGNYREVGLILQRSCIILTVVTAPAVLSWYFVHDIYSFLGVDEKVCDVVKNYLLVRIFSVPGDIIMESYEKYLMAIGVNDPSMWANFSFNVFLILFNCLFVFGFRWGYISLAISWVLATYISIIMAYILSSPYPAVQRTLQPLSWEAFENWWEFIYLGIPATVMVCSEWWAYEFLTLFATFLGTAQVAAQTIIVQILALAFMIPLGIGVSCAALVGNSIGGDQIALGIRASKVCTIFAVLASSLVGMLIWFGGDTFITALSKDADARMHAERAVPFLAIFVVVDSFQCILSSILRGAGKQAVGAIANVAAYYVIGLPMAYVMCFYLKFQVEGLVMGIAFGSACQVVFLCVLTFLYEDYLFGSSIVKKTPVEYGSTSSSVFDIA